MNYLVLFIVVLFVTALYLFPSGQAVKRRHPHTVAIFYLNVLLGWTVFGWVLALIWALVPMSHHVAVE